MKRIRYGKYVPEDFGLSAEDLMRALSDYFLNSGFDQQFYGMQELDLSKLDALKEAIREALERGDLFDEAMKRDFQQQLQSMSEGELEETLQRMVQKLIDEGYLNQVANAPQDAAGGAGDDGEMRVELSGKSTDFLGYNALRDLLGGLGRASFGAHATREESTGVESSGSSRAWEFGDTLNLDVSTTLFSAMQREGVRVPLDLEYSDLHVHQSDYYSSCATVLMLDCSHSMILYGEDRFSPAKRVALALSHLIRTQYPGDSLRLVLFHDQAEHLHLSELARVQVGPHYTNTRDGLILAQKLLAQEKKDMKQIIMITDGKPSAITLDDGRIYKNAFGMDPLVISRTLEEVSRCKRQGIQINTFMLASDYSLVAFVQKVTEMCRGKAYFTTPYTLGNYILMDYQKRKTKTVH
jgi:Ca-activated chloride channel homolog